MDKLTSLRHLDLKRVNAGYGLWFWLGVKVCVVAEERRSASASMRREEERLATVARQNKVKHVHTF